VVKTRFEDVFFLLTGDLLLLRRYSTLAAQGSQFT